MRFHHPNSSNSSEYIILIHPPSILYLFAIAGLVSRRGRLGWLFHGSDLDVREIRIYAWLCKSLGVVIFNI
jgi:hypothetical protein